MVKIVLLPFFLTLTCSGVAHAAVKAAYTGPDYSADTDGRIAGGITDSLQLDHPMNERHMQYFRDLFVKGVTRKITRLSSDKISRAEAKRLMLRRAKMDGEVLEQIKNGVKETQYLGLDLYRQYYLIEASKGFKSIATFYSADAKGNWPEGDKDAEACGVDLEEIYIISDTISGHAVDFATY